VLAPEQIVERSEDKKCEIFFVRKQKKCNRSVENLTPSIFTNLRDEIFCLVVFESKSSVQNLFSLKNISTNLSNSSKNTLK